MRLSSRLSGASRPDFYAPPGGHLDARLAVSMRRGSGRTGHARFQGPRGSFGQDSRGRGSSLLPSATLAPSAPLEESPGPAPLAPRRGLASVCIAALRAVFFYVTTFLFATPLFFVMLALYPYVIHFDTYRCVVATLRLGPSLAFHTPCWPQASRRTCR